MTNDRMPFTFFDDYYWVDIEDAATMFDISLDTLRKEAHEDGLIFELGCHGCGHTCELIVVEAVAELCGELRRAELDKARA